MPYLGSSTLSWSSTNATGCTASGAWNGTKPVNGSETQANLTAPSTFTLTCTGSGGTAAQSVIVTVTPAPLPTVSLAATPSTVISPGTSTLNWSTTNATSCTASGGWSGAKSLNGSELQSGLTATTSFALSCVGAGGTASQTVTVNVMQPLPTLALSASPAAIVQGATSMLTWSSTNATSCAASGDWTGTRSTAGSESTGALNTVRTYNYTLTCTGAGGSTSKTANLVVSATPPLPTVSISANPAQVASGGTSTLTWSSTNATTCIGSGLVGWNGAKSTSGTQVTPALTATTTFVLSCTGAGGTGTGATSVTVTPPPTTTAFPLKLSPDQRHLLDQNNRPFLVNGDTPWSLFTGLTKAEAETYLEDRRQRGFNSIIINLAEPYPPGPANRDGQLPFLKAGDFSTPNDAYFQHVDYVLNLARSKGFLVLITPAYLGFGGGAEGWWQDIKNSNSEAAMEGYGRFIGQRYRSFDNIVWVMGGDYFAPETLPKTRAIVRGIQATDQPRFLSAHNARQESGLLYYSGESWFNLNTTYSECSLSAQRSIEDYQRARVMPFLYFEGRYENESDWSDRCIRSQAYWSVLSGSIGHFFGNYPIWNFAAGWPSALNSTGSRSMGYYRRLFISRAWDKLVPDIAGTVLTGGRGALGPDYAMAARTADGATIIAYAPTQRALTIDMTKVAGTTARAWWFNPATGVATLIADYATSGNRSFAPPAAGEWVLVVDDASLGLPAPGQ